MHISLDSAIGQQRRLNQVGETISSIAAPTAAYSLRSLTGGDPKVVRVRRESDNTERDFTASGVSSGALVDFVNTQTVKPLDVRALNTGTGVRDGFFQIASAAYSLRSLGDRQATVSATGDTVTAADGKYVVQVRRSSDDTIKSFTADEVSDGTLVAFVGSGNDGFVRTWYDQSVTDQGGGTATDNHAVQATAANQPKIVSSGSLLADGIEFDGSSDELETGANISGSAISGFVVANLDGTGANSLYSVGNTKPNVLFGNPSLAYSLNGGSALSGGTAPTNTDTLFTQLFISGGTSKTFIDGSAIASGDAGSNTASSDKLTIGNLESINRFTDGSIKELIIYNSDQTDNRGAYEGNIADHYNISGVPTEDNTVNGFVETWYDQSGNGNDAVQATAASQPSIVTNGALNTSGGLEFDGTDNKLGLTNSISFESIAGSVISVQDSQSSQDNYTLGITNSNRGVSFTTNRSTWYFTQNQVFVDQSAGNPSGMSLKTVIHDGTTNNPNVTAFTNGTIHVDDFPSSSQGTANVGSSSANQIGAKRSTSFFSGTMKELIVYRSDQSANRTAIETNINSHYSIF